MKDKHLPRNGVRHVAFVGNPNSGKSTVFNALTGLRQKVANYPGVTVEKKEGRIVLDDGSQVVGLDLPGLYSLTATSPDERISSEILLGKASHTPAPDLVVCVIDASNLERNLYLTSQIIDLHLPVIIALNMVDVAEAEGLTIDHQVLQRELGAPVIPTVANRGIGIAKLRTALADAGTLDANAYKWQLPEPVEKGCEELAGILEEKYHISRPIALREAIDLLASPTDMLDGHDSYTREMLDSVRKSHARLDFLGIDRESVFVESRYEWIRGIVIRTVMHSSLTEESISDKIDRVLTHKVWGFVVFLGLMAIVFQTLFTWAEAPMLMLGNAFDWLGQQITATLPAGDLRDLLVNGGLAGVAAVVTFLPQILFLFLFLGLLEDTGYMARAAFIMDKLMSKVGLHGKSFIPLLSSFACAIPGIMATRTIENPKDRLVTILVAPLMSCSARLPVYTLLIAAFVPPVTVFGFLSLPALTMFSMYMLGLVAALALAWLFKKTLLRGAPPVFIMELPPYRMPSLKTVLRHMWERGWIFLKRAGTFILGVSIILWFLASYPRLEDAMPGDQLQQSFAGRTGQLIEPVIKPLGFDWKIGIGLIASLLQREVFVSTMGTIYNIQNANDDDGSVSLRAHLQADRNPVTGEPTFTLLTALCLMVYYVLAMQCMSTVAVVRRETNGWKWPLFQIGYMTVLAYVVTFAVYRAGLWLGIGG